MTCRLKIILSLFIILVFSSALAGEKQPKSSVSIHGQKLKTIIVDEYYPYTFVNKEGSPDGFSIDLAKAAAQVMDLDLEITVDTWDKAQNALKKGRIDFLPMMAYSKKRDRDFDFSAPHTIAYDAFFVRKGIRPIHSVSELADKTVIVMNKDQAHDYLISTGLITSDRFILVDSLPDALRILSSGRGDVAIMPKLIGLLHVKRLNLTNIDPSPVVINSYVRPFSFAVKEGDLALLERLSQGLNILESTGQYKTIYLKWFGIIDPSGFPTRTVMISGGILVISFAIIAVVILLWTFALRKQVALRTQHLEQEIVERERVQETLRESEEKYRSVVENIGIGIALISPNMEILALNNQMKKWFPDIDVSKKPICYKAFNDPPRDSVCSYCPTYKTIEDGQIHESISETPARNEIRYYRIVSSPIKDKNGKINAAIEMLDDITERKRAEKELQDSRDMLIRSEKLAAIGQLSAGVSHEILSPLNIISMRIQMLEMMEGLPEKVRDGFAQVKGQINRVVKITKDLSQFSRITTRKKVRKDINETVDHILTLVGSRLKFEQIALETDLQPDLPEILMEPERIEQVILNIINNAADASEGYEKKAIRIRTEVSGKENGPCVRLVISDNGKGIPPGDMNILFEPFFTTKEAGKGTGLGLYISYNIVQEHGGRIWAENNSWGGASLFIDLPVGGSAKA